MAQHSSDGNIPQAAASIELPFAISVMRRRTLTRRDSAAVEANRFGAAAPLKPRRSGGDTSPARCEHAATRLSCLDPVNKDSTMLRAQFGFGAEKRLIIVITCDATPNLIHGGNGRPV